MSDNQLELRLQRLEDRLHRVLTLLEGGSAAGSRTALAAGSNAFGEAVAQAGSALSGVHGHDEVCQRLTELLVRFAEPETVEAVTRLVVLVPQIEYAVQALAAGPELLEEGLASARIRLEHNGNGAHELGRRVDALTEAARQLSEPSVVRALTSLAQHARRASPLFAALAESTERLAKAEGPEHLRERVAEALLRLADAEVLESVTRLANLAPDLEYAVHFVAAGPALLEEAMEKARSELGHHGTTPAELQQRLARALQLLLTVTSPPMARALTEVAQSLPAMSPLLRSTAAATAALSAVEGADALEQRVTEALVRIADPEVLEALVRMANLAPDVEYAVHAVAAGPNLMQEAAEMANAWARHQDVRFDGLRQGMAGLVSLLGQLSRPEIVTSLRTMIGLAPQVAEFASVLQQVDAREISTLVAALGQPEALSVARRMLGQLPTIDAILAALPQQPETLATLKAANEAVAVASSSPNRVGMFGMLSAMRDPAVQRVLGFAVTTAKHMGKHMPHG